MRPAPFTTEYRLRRHDGGYRWVSDSATARIAAHGEFRGYIDGAFDVTDWKEAEAER